jgi:mono/diheme cytochrome c family protein
MVGTSAVLAAACGSDDGGTAPGDGTASADGAAVYAASCSSCHGADLRGTNRGPSQLSIVYEPAHHSDDSYRSAIANGVQPHHWNFGPMPPVRGLSEVEVEAVIAFIRSVQERDGFEPYPPD